MIFHCVLLVIVVVPLQFVSTLTPSKEHFVEGKKFYFRVTILQATGIPRDFTNVFVQFKYAPYLASSTVVLKFNVQVFERSQ